MSKSRSKSGNTAVSSSDVLTKVKDAAITKPAKVLKAAAQLPVKEENKSKKKKVKEPTPEPSNSESEESEESASSEEDSESEDETPVSNGKTNGVVLKGAESESSDAESDSSESSEDEAPTNGVSKVAAAKAESDDDSEEESDDSEEDESDEETVVEKATKNKGAVKAQELNKKLAPVKTDESEEESAEDDDESEEDSEADSSEADSSEESDEDEEVKTKPVQAAKRKAGETESPFAKKTKLAEAHGESSGSNLFVGNLSWNVDEAWLTSEFEGFGELSGVRIITDRDSGRSKGFGYVEFVNADDAAKAYDKMKGHELDGRAINVDFAAQRTQGNGQDRAQNRAKSYGDTTSPPSDTLFVGNLSFDVGQDAVSEAFGEYGTIMGVRLPTDRETGQPKGFGYVTFASVEEAKGALEAMQGYELEGRTVRLDYSQPRPQNGDSPVVAEVALVVVVAAVSVIAVDEEVDVAVAVSAIEVAKVAEVVVVALAVVEVLLTAVASVTTKAKRPLSELTVFIRC